MGRMSRKCLGCTYSCKGLPLAPAGPHHWALAHPPVWTTLNKDQGEGFTLPLVVQSIFYALPNPIPSPLSPALSHLSLCKFSRALGATLSVWTSSVLLRDRPAVPFTFTVFGTSTSPSTRASSMFLKLKFPQSVGSTGGKRQAGAELRCIPTGTSAPSENFGLGDT